jgi:hypothetical protein
MAAGLAAGGGAVARGSCAGAATAPAAAPATPTMVGAVGHPALHRLWRRLLLGPRLAL